jgi:hypothetical protein
MARETFDSDWLANRLVQRPRTPVYDKDGLVITISKVPAGKPHCVISMRNAIFSGQRPTNISFDADVEIRSLQYEGGEWMTDTPQEIWQMYTALEELTQMHEPELLVGGLGLGVFSHLAAEYAGAIVTTVERDERIINAVSPWSARKVVKDDIYKFADKVEVGEYDAAFLDTWQRTGEYCWITEVVPLRRKLAPKIAKIWCWQEDEMIGQIRLNGTRVMCIPIDRIPASSIHYRVLRYAAEQTGLVDNEPVVDEEASMMNMLEKAGELEGNQAIRGIIDRFLTNAGSPAWEAEFGQTWDMYCTQHTECKNELND